MSGICPRCGCGLFDHDGICEKAVERHLHSAEDETQHEELIFRMNQWKNVGPIPRSLKD